MTTKSKHSSDTPSVTVIIPVFNNAKYLEECLESVRVQTLTNIEILVINDGSSDLSEKIIESFTAKDCRIKLINNSKRKGVSFSRNKGVQEAAGEYISFLDADDFFPCKSSLEELYKEAKFSGADIVGGSLLIVDKHSVVTKKYVNQQYFLKKQNLSYKDYQFDGGFYRFIYSRKLLLNFNIFFPNLKRFQDPIFFIRALETVDTFRVIPHFVYAYRKGHKIVNWERKYFLDHVGGVLFLLHKSSVNHYARLHFLMLRNLARSISRNSNEFGFIEKLSIIRRSINKIDINLLKEQYKIVNIVYLISALIFSPLLSFINRRLK